MDNLYCTQHHSDVLMSAIACHVTGISMVYSTVCSGADQRKHQSSASLAFVRGVHGWPVNSPHKGPATRKMFSFDDVIMRMSDWCRFGDSSTPCRVYDRGPSNGAFLVSCNVFITTAPLEAVEHASWSFRQQELQRKTLKMKVILFVLAPSCIFLMAYIHIFRDCADIGRGRVCSKPVVRRNFAWQGEILLATIEPRMKIVNNFSSWIDVASRR